MKPEPAFGWALCEWDRRHQVYRVDVCSVRRTRKAVIRWARQTVRISDADKPWAYLKRTYRLKIVRVTVEGWSL